MTHKMNDDVISFAGGSLLASIPAFSWLWPLQLDTIDPSYMAVMWGIKVVGTVILGFLGGLTGMIGKDVYRHMKRKLYKHDKQD